MPGGHADRPDHQHGHDERKKVAVLIFVARDRVVHSKQPRRVRGHCCAVAEEAAERAAAA